MPVLGRDLIIISTQMPRHGELLKPHASKRAKKRNAGLERDRILYLIARAHERGEHETDTATSFDREQLQAVAGELRAHGFVVQSEAANDWIGVSW